MQYILPSYALHSELPSVMESLSELDKKVMDVKSKSSAPLSRDEMIYYMIRAAIIVDRSHLISWDEHMKDGFRQAKIMLSPITPANYELERAVALVLKYNGLKPKKNKKNKVQKMPVKAKAKNKRKPNSNSNKEAI